MSKMQALELISISTEMVLESRDHVREIKASLRKGSMTVMQARAETTLTGHNLRGARILQGNFVALSGHEANGATKKNGKAEPKKAAKPVRRAA